MTRYVAKMKNFPKFDFGKFFCAVRDVGAENGAYVAGIPCIARRIFNVPGVAVYPGSNARRSGFRFSVRIF